MKNETLGHNRTSWSWGVIGSFVAVGALLGCDNSPPAPPTEREKQEASTRAILREYGRPGQSEAEIDRGAKAVVDEWEKVTK